MDESGKDLGGMIEKLMGDPQVMELVKKLKEDSGTDKSGGENGEEPVQSVRTDKADGAHGADTATVLDTLGPLLKTAGRGSSGTENRNRLLSALKPYVNGERRDMIDKVTSISKLTSLFDAVGKSR